MIEFMLAADITAAQWALWFAWGMYQYLPPYPGRWKHITLAACSAVPPGAWSFYMLCLR